MSIVSFSKSSQVLYTTKQVIIALLIFFTLASCEAKKKPGTKILDEEPQVAADQLERVVTLGVDISEIVHDLGCGAKVVAVDESTTTIQAYNSLPRVGYYRNFSAEGVLAQRPTLIIASSRSGPPHAIEKLRASGVPVRIVDTEEGLIFVPKKILTVAQILGCKEAAQPFIERFLKEIQFQKSAADAPKVLFLMSPPGVGNWLAAGGMTVAAEVIELAGGRNAVTGFHGYKPLSREALAILEPELIIMPEDALARAGGLSNVLDSLGFPKDSPARLASVYEVNLAEFLSTGTRITTSIGLLRNRLAEIRKSPDYSAKAKNN